MSEEDLELLITLDDPDGAPEEDVFDHLHAKPQTNTDEHRPDLCHPWFV